MFDAVEHLAPSPGPPATTALKGDTTVIEPTRAEQAIARRSAEIRATVPDLELSATVAADRAVTVAERDGASVAAVVLAAVAAALRSCPRANAAYRDGGYELYSRVNIAVMLSGPDAPTMATILDADHRTPAELHSALTRLRARARSAELTPPEQAGATFTFTDLGAHGIERGTPLIVAPQAAALSAGAVREVPVLAGGAVRPGRVLTLTLAGDARILFGELAARFLAEVARGVERGVEHGARRAGA